MPNRFVETAVIGLIALLSQAVGLVPTGAYLVGKATGVMFANEGRTGLAEVAESAVVAHPDRPTGHDGKLVSVTGTLTASELVGDPVFFERGAHAGVIRQVEMFAWTETVTTETRRRWGGSREVDTIIEYGRTWTDTPAPPSWMRYPEGHENPEPAYRSARFVPAGLAIGAWSVDPMTSVVLDGRPVDSDDVDWTVDGRRLRPGTDGWFYLDDASPDAPSLGDLRIRFVVVPTGVTATALGDALGGALTPHAWADGVAVVPVVPGGRDDAIRLLRGMDTLLRWAVRIGGTVAVFFGLMLMCGPFFAIADIVPPFGFVVRLVWAFVLVPVAIAWSALTIAASQILHSPGLLMLAAVLASGVVLAWWDGRRRRVGAA